MRLLLVVPGLVCSLGAQAQETAADPFAPLRFLLGDWRGEGTGAPGSSAGAASFRLDLEGKVLVRRSRADQPAGKAAPGFHHEDLMTIFVEAGRLKAHYLDNEGHVIRYLVAAIPGGVAFTSEPGPGPRFRLTYLRKTEELVGLTFELAPPGKPEAFATYLEARMQRSR